MHSLLELWETPIAEELYMIAGWNQWADAGSISSGLPQYLAQFTEARKIGQIKPDGFYLFQLPGTHHLLRPEIKLKDGYRQSLSENRNEFFYAGDKENKLIIFQGEEPHMNVDGYADAFFDAVEQLGVKRVAAVGGVYGAMPYEKDREISCIYSMPGMKEELEQYAVRFSNYEGGATIGSFLVDKAEKRGIELVVFYGFVPAYDLAQPTEIQLQQTMSIETDFKAWHELMRRFNHMFKLRLDLSDLERESEELTTSMDEKIAEVENELPQSNVREYLKSLEQDFQERPFSPPLDDVWEDELGDLLDGLDQ